MRFIKCNSTGLYVSGVTSDFAGNINGASLTTNKDEAMKFDDSDYVFDFIQTAPDSGTMVDSFSDPVIGGFEQYSVVNEIGAIIPPNR